MRGIVRKIFGCMFFAVVLVVSVVSVGAETGGENHETVSVSAIQPAAVETEQVKPGLSVRYYQDFFVRDLRRLSKPGITKYRSYEGPPILELNHAFGREEVFDSGRSQGVALRLEGYIHFADVGEYLVQAVSNDGIIMYLDGVETLSDPRQHSDRPSNTAHVHIEEEGWYPVMIEYFQRKGTATLRLLWKTPGGEEMIPVPAKAYGHIPGN